MPRKRRPENAGLPPRWRFFHGAYRYQVPPGLEHLWGGKQQFTLGTSLAEAHRTWAVRVELNGRELRTIGQLLDRYQLEEVPKKADATQRGNLDAIKRLRSVFEVVPIMDFRPHHAYGYRDRRGKKAPTAANRELEVLSHAFTKAIEWGVPLETHPMIEGKFRKIHKPARDRYVEDAEVIAALSIAAKRRSGSVLMCQAYIRLKLLTGFRRTDLLQLRMSDLRADGIHVKPSKTAHSSGIRSFREWDDRLRAVVEECKAVRPVHISPWLFCNRDGEPYQKGGKANGFDSVWQRFMDRVVAEAKIARFQERDLRAKCATDAESLAHAQALLDHASPATTKRIYRRRAAAVKPGRGIE